MSAAPGLSRRIAAVERRLGADAANCDACGGDGPRGLRFFIHPQQPTPEPPCPRCGRASRAVTFTIVPMAPPQAPREPAARHAPRAVS